MREKQNGTRVAELPDAIRQIIRREVEDGLADFGAKDFEADLRAKLRRASEAAPRRFFFFKTAPAIGLTLAVVGIGAAILWLVKEPPRTGPNVLALTLEIAPGLANLEEYPLPSAGGEIGPASMAPGLVGRALFTAAGAAASVSGPGTEGAIKPLPRTTLEQKMRLLYGDRTIERALEPFRDKFKEV